MQSQQSSQNIKRYFDGEVMKRSEIFKCWKSRRILLKFQTGYLVIFKKKPAHNKTMNLQYYDIEKLPDLVKKTYYVINLKLNSKQQNKETPYKSIFLGLGTKDQQQEWYDLILKAKNKIIKEDENQSKNKNQNGQLNQIPEEKNNVKNEEYLKVSEKKQSNQSNNKYNKSAEQQQSLQTPTEFRNIDWEDISERKIQETRKLPYYTVFTKTQQLPKEKKQSEINYITSILEHTPAILKPSINQFLQSYLFNKGSDILSQTRNQFQFVQEDKNNIIFQSKINPKIFRSIITAQSSNQNELLQDLMIPKIEPHWHKMISKFDFEPEKQQGDVDIVEMEFQFRRFVPNIQQKEMQQQQEQPLEIVPYKVYYHRTQLSFQDADFILCKTYKDDHTDDTLNNYFNKNIILMKNPYDSNQLIILTEIQIGFQQENEQNLKLNSIQFLLGMNEILKNNNSQHDSSKYMSFRMFKQFTEVKLDDQNSENGKLFSNDVGSNENESLEVYLKNDQNNQNLNNNLVNVAQKIETSNQKLSQNGHNEDLNINGIQKKQTERYVPNNTINLDESFSKEQLIELLEIIKSNQHIIRSIKHYYPESNFNFKSQQLTHSDQYGHFAWAKYYEPAKKGGIKFLNEKLLKEQKGVAYTLIKRIGKSLMSGKSLMNISMPVTIFDKYTMLQRNARQMGYAPVFLGKAAQTTDLVEQLKYCVAYQLSQFILGVDQKKPFNPILGETFQARVNGYPIYFEQTMHHPPICNFLHYGPGYTLYGAHYPEVNTKTNSLEGFNKAHPCVRFKNNGKTFYIFYNNFNVYNILFGQRYMNCVGKFYCFEPESRLVAEVLYNPNDKGGLTGIFSGGKNKIDEIGGQIYVVNKQKIDQLISNHKSNQKITVEIDPNSDIEEYVSQLHGTWHKNVYFDNEAYWDTDKDFPYAIQYEENPLPSDSNYRIDLTTFRLDNIQQSQEQKEQMEKDQREDLKLRKKYEEQNKNNQLIQFQNKISGTNQYDTLKVYK